MFQDFCPSELQGQRPLAFSPKAEFWVQSLHFKHWQYTWKLLIYWNLLKSKFHLLRYQKWFPQIAWSVPHNLNTCSLVSPHFQCVILQMFSSTHIYRAKGRNPRRGRKTGKGRKPLDLMSWILQHTRWYFKTNWQKSKALTILGLPCGILNCFKCNKHCYLLFINPYQNTKVNFVKFWKK